jgi:magnesium chelatase family protein
MVTRDIGPDARVPNHSPIPGDDVTRRALEIALAGGHHLLLLGPAGSGKTGLVQSIPGLLPPLRDEEAREVGAIYRRAGEPRLKRSLPPIRIPHPVSTAKALFGSARRLGELDLAHRGVLVLRNLPDFRHEILRALREPLEEGLLRLSGPGGRRERPVAALLLATMRSCPCGGLTGHERGCACTWTRVLHYRRRAAEPLGFLFDIQCEMKIARSSPETSAEVRARIMGARALARTRFGDRGRAVNAAMTAEDLRRFCPLDRAGEALREATYEKLGLTPGIFARALRVARTIADLNRSEAIRPAHLAEALGYRSLLLPGSFLQGTPDGTRPLAP